MRIALVTQHFAPHFEGGTEAVARAHARALAARGHEVKVVAGTDRPYAQATQDGGVSEASVDGLPVTLLHRRGDEPYDLILERPRLARRVAALCAGADVVHVHHWSTLDNALVRNLSRRTDVPASKGARRPVVVTLHDHFTTCPRFFRVPAGGVERCPEPGDLAPCVRCCAADAPISDDELAAGLAARARSFTAKLDAASARIAPSRAHAAALARALGVGADAFAVVPHGLLHALERLAPPPAPDRGAPLCVLHLGHRASVKGTLDLARAIGLLAPEERARVRLFCIGAEVEPGLDARVREAAHGAPVEIAGAYDAAALGRVVHALGGAHVAALPSRAPESYGLVLDEALALGIPALVADSGALPERLGGAGRVLPAADPPAWAAALSALLADPGALVGWRAALPDRVRTAADAAAALEDLYERSLSATP